MIPAPPYRSLRGAEDAALAAAPVKGEQTNSSIVYGDRLILKLLRKVEAGTNPDLEIGRFLTERTSFTGSPPVAGHLEYRREGEEPVVLGLLTGFVPNEGDTWTFTLDELERYFEAILSRPEPLPQDAASREPLLKRIEGVPPPVFRDLAGSFLEVARRLGQRTADLHVALASVHDDPDFAPEPFLPHYQRSIYQSMRNRLAPTVAGLRRKARDLPEAVRADAQKVLELEGKILERFKAVSTAKLQAVRIRIHGDLHLGQVLNTGKDFAFLDFEGEPGRPISERRIKRSPLRDVAGMLRSFHYASQAALFDRLGREETPQDRLASLETGARLWYAWTASAFLRAYLDRSGPAAYLPGSRETLGIFLDAFILDKCVYELDYELNHRPYWVRIPLKGLLHILEP
jgi:maltose alpha-D-glucosyltransferase/alpha-amylase